MPLYDHLHGQLRPDLGAYAPAFAGMGARAAAVIVTAPLELTRTRQQAGTSTRGAASVVSQASSSWRWMASSSGSQQVPLQGLMNSLPIGLAGMWRGVGATLARDVPFTCLYWCAVEPIRARILASGPPPSGTQRTIGDASTALPDDQASSSWGEMAVAAEDRPSEPSTASSVRVSDSSPGSPAPSTSKVLWANLVAGSISGALAAAATTPFDVVKTRLQTMSSSTQAATHPTAPAVPSHHHQHQYCRSSRGTAMATWFLPQAQPSRPVTGSPGTLGVMQEIWRAEGVRGLFAGVGPRAARSAPACAIVIAAYEVLKTAL